MTFVDPLVIVIRSFITYLTHQLHDSYQGIPAQFFFRGGMFLFPRSLAFDLWYDLDIWGQGQALKSFFIGTSFAIIVSRV